MQVKDYNVQEISGGVGQVQEKLEFAGLRRSWFFLCGIQVLLCQFPTTDFHMNLCPIGYFGKEFRIF